MSSPLVVGTSSGAGLAQGIERYIKRYNVKRVFLVTGKRSFEQCGAKVALAPLLAQLDEVTHYCEFSPNPTLEEVEHGAGLLQESSADMVIAVGGGSALDIGKMVNSVCANKHASARSLLTGASDITSAGLPLVAVPTTSGSGAEVTQFAAVYVDGKKFSVTHDSMLPTHSILDATLTASLSPYLTAATGMDALAQAIESYWSLRSNEESREFSRQAILLCTPAIVDVTTAPSLALREQMLEGSHLAGKAIAIARTTAPHALSYMLTTDFGVTHGHAVALTLGSVFSFNSGAGEPKKTMSDLCDLMGCAGGEEAHRKIVDMMTACGLKTRLRDVGVSRSDLVRLTKAVNPQRLKNNPCELNDEALGRIVEQAF